eukprot:TRINITY_DN1824_c0_g1_i2.p1 TRINITY_DN1824_c0_g1~~TRINITY_DN1824_c0_g1_i2.p1  ORF type:complete len:972 (+),score=163.13 TRINITY_DN1824_c0_g1_i2:748-3663(+)
MSHSGVRRIEQQRNTSTKPKSAGRGTSSQICEGMAEDYQEPMVIGNLKEGNEIRIRKDSSANEEAIIHNFKRRRKNYFKTYQRIIREKSDRRSKGKEKIQGIFPSTIHSEEERDRQKTSSIGCKTVEPAHEEETFQDGGDNNIEESYKKERLHDESRSDRRLLSRTYQQKISEISEVRMEGTSIPIQGITFWDHLRSSYFHKDNESTNSLSSKEGDEDYHLHRRHTDTERDKGKSKEKFEDSIKNSAETGFFDTRGKVQIRTNENLRVPGIQSKIRTNDFKVTKEQGRQIKEGSKQSNHKKRDNTKKVSSVPRGVECNQLSDNSGKTTFKSTTKIEESKLKGDNMGPEMQAYKGDEGRINVVERSTTTLERKGNNTTNTTGGDHNGCIRNRIWSSQQEERLDGEREMEQTGEKILKQCEGAISREDRTDVLPDEQEGFGCSVELRQHDSSSVYEPPRRNMSPTEYFSKTDLVMVPEKKHNSDSKICSRKEYKISRRVVTGKRRQTRLDAKPRNIQESGEKTRAISDGSVCLKDKQATEEILLADTGHRSSGNRCVLDEMGGNGMGMPTTRTNWKNYSKNTTRQSNCSSACTQMDSSTMVARSTRDEDQGGNRTTRDTRFDYSNEQGSEDSLEREKMENDCVSFIRSVLKKKGMEEKSIILILKSLERSEKTYNSGWRNWVQYCKETNTRWDVPDEQAITNWLAGAVNRKDGKKRSNIDGFRSAISTIFSITHEFAIGKSTTVSRLVKGINLENPKKPRYNEIFDIDILLDWIKKQGSTDTLEDRTLRTKVILLIRICRFARSSDISKIIMKEFKIEENYITFRYLNPKGKHKGGFSEIQKIEKFEKVPELCPYLAIKEYLSRTENRRAKIKEENNQLIISEKGAIKPLKKETISKLCKEAMEKAGINTRIYKAASIRHASASKAVDLGMEIEEVLETGCWTSRAVFETYYNRSVRTKNAGSVILLNHTKEK